MKQFYTLLLTFLLPISLFSQKSMNGFPKLTETQLNLKTVDFDKNADAVILSEQGFMVINSGNFELKLKRRIKVLTEKGIEEGNVNIPYYAKKKNQQILHVKAQTINNDNGTYVSTPVNSKDIYDVNLNEYYNQIKFALPNVKVGTIIEYEYTLLGQGIYLIDAWEFQHQLPTLSSEFSLDINAPIDYTNLTIGKNLNAKYNKNKDNKRWELVNVPSIKDIKYTYNSDNYSEKIKLQMAGYHSGNGYVGTISKWNDLRKELNENNSRTFNSGAVKKYASSIPTSGTDKEILEQVLSNFKDNFKWNDFYGIYTSKQQKEILENRSSNVADLNFLLNSILKEKGLKSDLILVSTRSNGKLLTSFPFLDQFNYVVNLVTLGDNSTYVINAADIPEDDYRFAPLNLFNDYGYNIHSKNDEFITFNQFLSENNTEFKYLVKNGEIFEQRKDTFDGYFYNKRTEKNELINRYISSPITVINDDELKTPIFKDKKYTVNHTTKNKFQSPSFLPIENPLKQFVNSYEFTEENRTYPLEFNFPYYHKVVVTIDIPEGYKIDDSEEFKKLIKKSENLVYNQNYARKDNKLQIIYELYFAKARYESTDYDLLKTFFTEVQQANNKQLVLKKI